jgi:branched-chain amino acid transport system substrate-binding protein
MKKYNAVLSKKERCRVKKIAFAAIALILLFSLVFGSTSSASRNKVGIFLPLSGKLAKYGDIEHKSFLMAAEEINASKDFDGKKIELIIEDTHGKPDVGRSVIDKLIQRDQVIAICGGFSSSVTWQAAQVAQKNKIPCLVNTGSADKITEQGWEYIFRLNPPVGDYAATFVTFIKEVAAEAKKIAILHMNSDLGLFLAKKFSKQADALGMQIAITQGFDANATNFRPLLEAVKAEEPDLVYTAAHNIAAASLMRQAKEINLNPKLFWGHASGYALPEFQINAGDAAEFVWSAVHWTPAVPYPGAQKYYDTFAARYGISPDYHGAQAYSAMYVLADAIKRANELTPEGVRNALAKTDMMTVYGPVRFISYDKKVQQNRLPTLLVQWINGRLEVAWPKGLATQKYVYPTPKWSDRPHSVIE